MNKVFKKKASDGPDALSNGYAIPYDSGAVAAAAPSTMKKPSTSIWRKGKKQPEAKPVIDLQAALPSTDDFRTSLLMPNLSARFSMLREQDDPTSLLGKASDDSVLQPRRRSRMIDFGYGSSGLGDIAEGSSPISPSFRPPFAAQGRTASYGSEEGYGSDNAGSVMSRARPGEGNILFGGRQKIYRIATSANGSTKSLGKAVYEDDIGASAFQRYRQREREREREGSQASRPSNDSSGFDFGLDRAEAVDRDDASSFTNNDSAKDLSHSPSLFSYDKKRSTSSTAHSEARSSTAATSIASQPAPSPAAYGASGGPTSPFATGLDRSNTKSRRLYDQGLDQHMREEQTSALSRLNSIHRQRPHNGGKISPPMLNATRSATNLNERVPSAPYSLRTQSPTMNGPLGAASRMASTTPSPAPSSPIDNQLEAQFDLQQALDPHDRGKATAMGAFNKPKQSFDEQQYLERQKQLLRAASSVLNKNMATSPSAQLRAAKLESERERPDANKSVQPANSSEPTSYSVFQKAASQLQESSKSPASTKKAALPDTHRTFFGNIHASDSEDDDENAHMSQQAEHGSSGYPNKWQPAMPPVSEHPALRGSRSRASLAAHKEEEDEQPVPNMPVPAIRTDFSNANPADDHETPSSAVDAQPIGSMMRHLRSKSNTSSMYPGDEAGSDDESGVPDMPAEPVRKLSIGLFDFESKSGTEYTESSPWDLSLIGNHSLVNMQARRTSVSPVDDSVRGSAIGGSRTPISPVNEGPSPFAPSDREITPAWQRELHQRHSRDASSATQQERDAFASELAARREAIRENMKSIVDVANSRDASPAPAPSTNPGPFKALNMLRTKASGESIANARDQQTKNLKSHNSFDARARDRSSSRPRMANHPALQNPPMPNQEHPAHREERSRSGTRSRSRSTSRAPRSRSRASRFRDGDESPMPEGPYPHTAEPSPTPMLPRDFTPRRSPDVLSTSTDGRVSDDSRSPISPRQAGPPTVPVANGYNPIRPLQITSAYPSTLSGLPQSGASPPIPYQPYIGAPVGQRSRSNTLRKKTISKAEISEPTLLSSTSNIDTVDLPEGASLKNGMEPYTPPIPPINPKRRGTLPKVFGGLGRSDSDDFTATFSNSKDSSEIERERFSARSKSPESEFHFPPSNVVRMPGRQVSSKTSDDYDSSLYSYSNPTSPERVERSQATVASMNGAMF